MPKRDRDTAIWRDPFYRSLPPLYKTFWDFINDDCDNSGVWLVDFSLAKIQIGKRIDKDQALEYFAPRVLVFEGGMKWHIKSFIPTVLGFSDLDPASKFQKSIIDLLNKHNLIFIKDSVDTLQSVKERTREGQGQGQVLNYKKEPEKIDVVFQDYEQWTQDVVNENDPQFQNLLRNNQLDPGEKLKDYANSFLGLLAQYPNKKPTDQHRFRVSLIAHIREKMVTVIANGKGIDPDNMKRFNEMKKKYT